MGRGAGAWHAERFSRTRIPDPDPGTGSRIPHPEPGTPSTEASVAMRIIGTGIDLIECERVADLWARHRERVTDRLLTPAECEYVMKYKDFIPRLAGRFAAKEAILKVVGTGWRGGIAWRDMEILNNHAGCPVVTLTGETARVADGLGITQIFVSITHTQNYGAATATGVGD